MDSENDPLPPAGSDGFGREAEASDELAGGPDQWEAFEERLARVASGVPTPDPADDSLGAPATVLLTGESGAGKSRAARRFHDLSGRRDGPFVSVHLSGLASTLLEGELFGHEAGAFTGAVGAREGRFVRASGGTLVLEAIETLDLALQVKLLRVLQERVVEPLGSEDFVEVDVQVIATTGRSLARAVEEGQFREDLYYRLAVVPLQVPPLRTRTHGPGFEGLCQGVMAHVAARAGVAPRALSPEALAALAAHPWPGNFRELENAIERVLVLGSPGETVRAEEVAFLGEGLAGRAEEIALEALASGVGLEELEAAVLEAALEQEKGNVSAAARCVGLSRRAFSYRRKKLDGA
ncbi:Transcriptional regulatory protein ZraR [Planctomycetes bacterium Poly30]|uniref:Transcriptional regulatory protein ZraR n=1 Tax=Saltatorellus ferox TaxID=2528018 RepID=A0A518EX22_9BACT|nr:Transcriptional regulatory protein ZraR [Planctomycetes bacterium Poly30]